MFKSILVISCMMSLNLCQINHKLPGSNMNIEEAIKKSMIVPISKTTEIKYKKPIVAKCTAIEEPVEPGQLIIDSCYYYQKFKFEENISGNINKEFNCDYKILHSSREQSIRVNRKLILILQDDKSDGNYHLIKALYDTKNNRQEIKSSIEKLSYLIKLSKTGGSSGTVIKLK